MSLRSASYRGYPPTCEGAGDAIVTIRLHIDVFFRHEIFLATKHGVEAKNYEGLGDAAKLKPLEVNFCL